jgi:membrane associated rhomboid family serine protease
LGQGSADAINSNQVNTGDALEVGAHLHIFGFIFAVRIALAGSPRRARRRYQRLLPRTLGGESNMVLYFTVLLQ